MIHSHLSCQPVLRFPGGCLLWTDLLSDRLQKTLLHVSGHMLSLMIPHLPIGWFSPSPRNDGVSYFPWGLWVGGMIRHMLFLLMPSSPWANFVSYFPLGVLLWTAWGKGDVTCQERGLSVEGSAAYPWPASLLSPSLPSAHYPDPSL